MIYGYIRISTHEQNMESQKNVISRYCMEHKLIVDEWIELEMDESRMKCNGMRRMNKPSFVRCQEI